MTTHDELPRCLDTGLPHQYVQTLTFPPGPPICENCGHNAWEKPVTTCKAWIPTDSGNRFCGDPATHRMMTRRDGVVSVCEIHYEEARGKP